MILYSILLKQIWCVKEKQVLGGIMKDIQAFNILGIDITKDEKVIKEAYVSLLALNHPEENPEGFKHLREAYETAVEYANKEAKAIVLGDEIGTPLGELKGSLQQLYSDFTRRINNNEWKQFLNNDIFEDLEYFEDAKWSVFSFLCDNFRLKFSTYQLLNDKFGIVEHVDEFREELPGGFVDYMLRCIGATKDNDILYDFIRGEKTSEYDEYISKMIELENVFRENSFFVDVDKSNMDKQQFDYLKEIIDSLEHLGLNHTYYDMYKAKFHYMLGQKDKALEMSKQLVNKPVNEDSICYHGIALSIIFDSGEKEYAKDAFLKLLEIEPGLNIANRYLSKYYYLKKDYKKAMEYFNCVEQYGDNEMLSTYGKGLDEKYVAWFEKRTITSDTEEIKQYLYCLFRLNECEKGLKYLDNNSELEGQLKSYHKIKGLYQYKLERYEAAAREFEQYDKELGDTKEDIYEKASNLLLLARVYGYISLEYAGTYQEDRVSNMRSYKDKAMNTYLEADQLYEGNYQAKREIIFYAVSIEKYDIAIAYSKKYLDAYPDDVDVLLKLQEAYFGQEMAQEVIDLHYRIINLYDKNEWTYINAAKTFMLYGQYEDAYNILESASKKGVQSMMLDVTRAQLECVDLDSLDEKLIAYAALLKKAKKYDKMYKDFQKEKNALKLIRSCDGDNEAIAKVYYDLAEMLLEDGGRDDYAKARNYLLKSKAFHESYNMEYAFVRSYTVDREFESGIEHCHKIGAAYGYDFNLYMQMGNIVAQIFDDKPKEYIKFIKLAGECIGDEVQNIRRIAYEIRANALSRKWYSILKYSNKWWDKLRQINQEYNSEATYYIAHNYYYMLHYENAIKYALESDHGYESRAAKMLMAIAYKKLGQFNTAIEILDSIPWEDAEDRFGIALEQARIYEASGAYNNAIEIYKEYLSMPEEINHIAVDRLCWLYVLSKDYAAIDRTIQEYKTEFDENKRYLRYKYLSYAPFSNEDGMKMIKDLELDAFRFKNELDIDSDFIRDKSYYDNIYLISTIHMGMGNVFAGMKLKNNFIIRHQYHYDSNYDIMTKFDSYIEIAGYLYMCKADYGLKGWLGGLTVLMDYYRHKTFTERDIIDRFINDPDDTLKRICFAIKYCCYSGLFKKAFEIIEDKLQNPMNMVDFPIGEADCMAKEALAIYFETTGDEAKAMALYEEINQKYGTSMIAKVRCSGYCFHKYDLPATFKESFGNGQIKLKRVYLFLNENEEDILYVIFDKKTTVEERVKYGFPTKYTRGIARYVLADGELKDEVKRVGKRISGTNKIKSIDEKLLKYVENVLTEQGIVDTEARQLAELEKYVRKLALEMMLEDKKNNDFGYKRYSNTKNTISEYGQKLYRTDTIKHTRSYKVIDRVNYDICEIYYNRPEMKEEEIDLFMKGELRG